MRIAGVSQSTGADRVVGVEASGADIFAVVTDRSNGLEMGRAVIPSEGLMAVLSDKPPGAQALEDVSVEVWRNAVWLVVRGAEAAVGLDGLTDAVGSVAQ